jgi:hypothetical protein
LYLCEKQKFSNKIVSCSNCNQNVDIKKKTKFFIYNNIRNQIHDLLKDNIDNFDLNNVNTSNNMLDIYDGVLYTNFRKKKHPQDYYITLTINTDGADVFKSKKTWFCMANSRDYKRVYSKSTI